MTALEASVTTPVIVALYSCAWSLGEKAIVAKIATTRSSRIQEHLIASLQMKRIVVLETNNDS
jgi:hypothetical protein